MKRDEIITFASLTICMGAIMWLYSSARKRSNKQGSTIMDNPTLPRGYRNNNPLNIRYNKANNWLGKVANNTDGRFEQFVAMEYGYRAALYLIRKYIQQDGLTTVAQIISKWAPSTENNTQGYINRVYSTTGWVPSKVIDPNNMQDMCDLAYAMALVENGTDILPDYTQIYKGWAML